MSKTPIALMVAAVLIVVAVVSFTDPDPRRGGPRLDPQSTWSDGARAAVLLLEGDGILADVGMVPSPGETGSLVVLVDDLSDDAWRGVTRFVREGGDLVLAAPFAPLAPQVRGTELDIDLDVACDVPELATVRELEVPVVRTFHRPDGAVECLNGAVVVAALGAGRVMTVGTAHPWRNDALTDADHAALVLGAARWGDGPVRFLTRGAVGTGDRTLRELVPDWVWAALVQLGLAGVVYAWWRAQRFGPPVEPDVDSGWDPLALAESVAELSARTEDHEWAADLITARWNTELRRRYGFQGDVDALVARLVLDADEERLVRSSLDRGAGAPIRHAEAIAAARRVVSRRRTGPVPLEVSR